jgi:predicted flap endonuclease-1-like 5' DNA nuclease
MSLFSFLIGGVVGGLAVYFFQQTKEQQKTWESAQTPQEGSTETRDLKSQLQQQEDELTTCKTELQAKTEEMQGVSDQLAAAEAQISALREQIAKTESEADAEPEAPISESPQEEAPPAQPDDLSKVEGIGPKTAEVLQKGGILTFTQLAQTDVEQLRAILEEAGPNYKRMEPESWPEQAALAAKGDWDTLKELQDQLDGGKYKKP